LNANDDGAGMLQQEQLEHETIIERWMTAVSRDGGIERFDHLHIDKIDETWRSKPSWIEGGLAAFRVALRLRDRHRLPVKVELSFSLRSDNKKTDVDFRTPEEFASRLDWTPPSLYLFGALEQGQRCF
jgi:hypothetical protein